MAMNRMRLWLVLLGMAMLLAPRPAMAWWDMGHTTIARIAQANVAPKTRAAIAALLRHAPDLATPGCPVNSMAAASVWPDCIKTLGDRFSYQYSWHYQNISICQPYDVKVACPDGNCVTAQIDRNFRLLKDRKLPARERLMALAFLVHFVGDLHQPLHGADKGDLGGNRQRADYGDYAPEKLNLHTIWDGWLAERAITTPPPLVRRYSAAERAAMAGGGTEDWSRESWVLSRDMAYGLALGGDPCAQHEPKRGKLDQGAIEKLVPVVREQVEKAGLRLARLLDEALG